MFIPSFGIAPPPPPDRLFTRDASGKTILEIWPRSGAGTLLFYPGTMVAPGHYRTFLLAAARAGFGICALHLTGHGRNAAKGSFTFESMLAEGLSAEAWLFEHGFGPVAVCGHSQGGILALAHAGQSSRIACAYSLCAALPRMDAAIALTHFAPLAKYRKQLLTIIKKAACLLPGLPIPLPFYLSLGKILAGSREPVESGGAGGRISYPLKFLASLFDADIDSRLKCPYWLYAAKNDALFTPALIRAVFLRLEAPAKTLVFLEDGGHLFPLNPNLAEFTATHMAAAFSGLGLPLNIAC